MRDLWAPFGFVNLLAPVTILIAIPQLLANLLSINNFTWSLRFHYIAIPLMASMLGFVLGLKRLRGQLAHLRGRHRARGLDRHRALRGASARTARTTRPATGRSPCPRIKRQIEHALSLIPSHAAVSASYHLVPHLTDRRLIYSFPNPWQGRNWGINDEDQRNPESVRVARSC